ncbi:LysM peptidoglycan-binding domain-containing protein [Microbacterium sp. HMH0099]|uniref:LysM peptidoglycan-binding domain-containing protein n=1 Tax=Microbacterium sp. HMH0099 TaxID=3414026 RepID=UPI003BF68470
MRRRLPVSAPAAPRSRAATVPAALAGSIALALAGEHAAHAVPPAPAPATLPGPHPVPTTLAPRVAALPAPAVHVVQSGDTVSSIAARYGLDTNAVLAANGLGWSSIIRPGQELVLSAPAAAPAPAPAPAAAYEVRAGDTLSGIAAAHGVGLDAVLSANGLTRASIIYPGETLQIPSGMVAVASVAPVLAPGLDAEQSANARTIIRIGRELGVPERGIAIALGTAMQESWLRNLDWGDRDSVGLFQQRPSTGWGAPDQLMDPDYATRAFFLGVADAGGTVTLGLVDIPGWEVLPYADAAQAVQISAYPDRYGQWEQPATVWLAALG